MTRLVDERVVKLEASESDSKVVLSMDEIEMPWFDENRVVELELSESDLIVVLEVDTRSSKRKNKNSSTQNKVHQ